MPKVYIVNRGGHDYTPAEKYGTLIFLSEGMISGFATNKIYREFSMTLRESGPDDFILLTGPTIMSVIACCCFSFLHGRVNLLIFKNGGYIERKLMLGNLLSKGRGTLEEQISEITDEGGE